MHEKLQQFDLQSLIDLLAEETEKYTKALLVAIERKLQNTACFLIALDLQIELGLCL